MLTHSTVDGSLLLDTTDFAYDTEVWTIKLYQKSTYSTHANGEGVYEFTVTFRDSCWDSVLNPATFSTTTFSWDIFDLQNMPFNPMVDTSKNGACGGYTYEVEYGLSGTLSNPDMSHYSIGIGPAIEGTTTDINWVGTHPLRIKCTNGVFSSDPAARGTNGLFKSVYSDEI